MNILYLYTVPLDLNFKKTPFPYLNCFRVVPLSSRLRMYLACSCGVTCTLLVTYYARQFRVQ